MEFSGREFKSQSGQLSVATSKNPSVVNTIYIYNLCGQINKTQKHAGEPNIAEKVFVI